MKLWQTIQQNYVADVTTLLNILNFSQKCKRIYASSVDDTNKYSCPIYLNQSNGKHGKLVSHVSNAVLQPLENARREIDAHVMV